MKILVIAVHPDDESLGCGGTILKHVKEGHEVYWMILTNIHEYYGWDKDLVEKRQDEITAVSAQYGFKKTYKLEFPTTKLDTIPMSEMVQRISLIMREIEPEAVYLPNRSDIHTDHQVAFKAIINCTKNFRFPSIKRVLMYECLSETEFAPALAENAFVPNVFVDITEYLWQKLGIIEIYKSELMEYPLPRSLDTVEILARYRGSRIGRDYAESFMLLEEIND